MKTDRYSSVTIKFAHGAGTVEATYSNVSYFYWGDRSVSFLDNEGRLVLVPYDRVLYLEIETATSKEK